jgi:hypothetical protein
MAQFGDSTTPTAGYDYPGTTGYAAASQFTMPAEGGLITELHGYFDAVSGSPQGWVCMWSSGGTLLASQSVGNLNDGTVVAGGQQWYGAILSTPYYLAGGTTVWLGFVSAGSLVFSSETGGSSNYKGMTSPGSFSGSSSTGIGTVGAYAVYTPGNAYTWNGSSWVAGGLPEICTVGTTFTGGVPYVWDGSSWVQGS